jgi:hypothetical protein
MTETTSCQKHNADFTNVKTHLSFILPICLLPVLLLSCGRITGDYTVMKGAFRQSVTETGELQAIKASTL